MVLFIFDIHPVFVLVVDWKEIGQSHGNEPEGEAQASAYDPEFLRKALIDNLQRPLSKPLMGCTS